MHAACLPDEAPLPDRVPSVCFCTAGQSSRRGTARAGAAKHKSLNVDTMLGQVSGDDDTDAARDGDASDCEDNALPCGIDPQVSRLEIREISISRSLTTMLAALAAALHVQC